MRKSCLSAAVVAAAFTAAASTFGAIAPYSADANTLGLYHFDEVAGAADPGNPFGNAGSNGVILTNTGGPDGRSNTTTGGYGAAALTGFGSSFDVRNSGNGTYFSVANAQGGGARTSGAVTQSLFQGANGAFTYEALFKISDLTGEQTFLSHDGDMAGSATTTRGFMLRIVSTGLSFYHGLASGAAGSVVAPFPSAGSTHAFAANEWFHVAVTYDGNEGAANSLKLYWTRVDSGAESANLLGSGIMPADLGSTADGNWFAVGSTTRGEFRFQPKGFVDEVRISDIARGPDQFMFSAAVPEPSALALLALAGAALAARRRD